MQLRNYQREAVDSVYSYFYANSGNPLIVVPTAGGKSLILAAFIQEVLFQWPDQRLMVLTHVRELIEQNYQELVKLWPLAPAGIYSAGLKRRESDAQVLFAGIQSIHNRAKEIGDCDLILVDEAHLVGRSSGTMFRRFFNDMMTINDQLKVIGLTATHYRMDSGLLTEGDDRLFTDVAYEVPVKRLIDEGWLAPLITKAPRTELDVSGVHTRGGDFIPGELATAVDRIEINAAAVQEIINYGRDRKSWLIFCTSVHHAYHIRDVLREQDVVAEAITGETNSLDREYILGEFKAGHVRAVTNCDILTTGFNHPGVDLIAFLRPTQSTGLYVQMAGRGMRNAPDKENCLILDFAGNIQRHGPIDLVTPKNPKKDGDGSAPVKTCPRCRSIIFAGYQSCPDCGFEFPPPETTLIPKATSRPIISAPEPFWVQVERITYARHQKTGKPDSLRVTYHESMFTSYSEWVCLEHGGSAARRAHYWWVNKGGDPSVFTVSQALLEAINLRQPNQILVQEEGKYWRVIRHRFDGPHQPRVEVEVEQEWDYPNTPLVEEELPF